MTSLAQMVAVAEPKLRAWWDFAEQDTPALLMTGPAPGAKPVPDPDDLERYWFDVEEGVQRAIRQMANRAYYGVALPYHWPDWGASTYAGVLGANMEMVGQETFWAHPVFERLEDVLHVDIAPQNRFYRAAMATTRRSLQLAPDHHFVCVYTMVGIGDILAGLYGTLPLLYAMAEQPMAVKAAMEHVTQLWLRDFHAVQDMIDASGNPGGINWMGIWAPGRTCATQEDISYMISDAMFREFCLPPLVDLIDSLDYPMYHLDGVGAISHLDTLLAIPRLRAIQWVPGAGRESVPQWYGLIRRILAAGKSAEVFAGPDEIDDLVRNVGTRGLLIGTHARSPEEAERLLERYPQR